MLHQRVRVARLVLTAGIACAFGHAASAQDVTAPGDFITPSSFNHPAGEPPSAAIDNSGATKYLNFDELNTGFTVLPNSNGVVRGLVIVTANDAPERDPTSFLLEGSNDGIDFVVVAQGALNPPTARFAIESASFDNDTSYLYYRVTFPTIRSAASANSMQVAEVQLVTHTDVLTPGDPFVVTYSPDAFSGPGEGAASLFDNRLQSKFGVFNAHFGPTWVDVTPGVGATVVTGFDIFGAADDLSFTGRAPSYIAISGSNDGVNFVEFFSTAIAARTANYQDEQFTFANTNSYTTYRIEFGPPQGDTFLQISDIQLHGTVSMTPPSNDDCASPISVGVGTTAGTSFNATGADITACGADDSADVWYSYQATATGLVEANTFGSSLDTTLAVYSACNGAAIACDDNTRGGQSRVRWNASSGQTYLIRVAAVDGNTGNFSLTIDDTPVDHENVHIPLNYNFNGMVHNGEGGNPDNPNGFRGISDRAIRITGTPGSLDVGLEGDSGISYYVETAPGVLDIIHLGNRNQVDGGTWAFDPFENGDDVGTQPQWLSDPDQTGPHANDIAGLGLTMTADTRIGVLYNASNGGSNFEMAIAFDDGTIATLFLSAPDWFGDQVPPPASFGLESQEQFGLFFGSGLTDTGTPSVDLNVVEAIVSTNSLLSGGYGDLTGKVLQSITFQNTATTFAATAIYAVTVQEAVSVGNDCPADFDNNGTVAVPDIFAFLSVWFAHGPGADFDNNGAIAVPDIFAFLSAWFTGCP